MERTGAATAMAGDIRLDWGRGSLRPGSLLGAEVLLATDRPDHVELTLADRSPLFGGSGNEPGLDEAPAAGSAARLLAPEALSVTGVVERVVHGLGAAEPPTVTITLGASYHGHRERFPSRVLHGLRAGELARRIAVELGLRAEVDEETPLLGRIELVGDPLAALRRVARTHGLGLAVHAGTLHLVREIGDHGSSHVLQVPLAGDGALVIEERADATRFARWTSAGPCRVRPLDGVRIDGPVRRGGGRFRVLRCGLSFDGWRWWTEAVLVEDRGDATWLNSLEGDDPSW